MHSKADRLPIGRAEYETNNRIEKATDMEQGSRIVLWRRFLSAWDDKKLSGAKLFREIYFIDSERD